MTKKKKRKEKVKFSRRAKTTIQTNNISDKVIYTFHCLGDNVTKFQGGWGGGKLGLTRLSSISHWLLHSYPVFMLISECCSTLTISRTFNFQSTSKTHQSSNNNIYISRIEAPYSLYVTICIRSLKLCFNHFFENVKSCVVNIESIDIAEQFEFYSIPTHVQCTHGSIVLINMRCAVIIKIQNSYISQMKDMLLFNRNPQIISNYFLKKYLCSDVFQVLINETYYWGCSKKKVC